MAKRKNNKEPEQVIEEQTSGENRVELSASTTAAPVPTSSDPVVITVKKKRIRDRKKTVKKLSTAILCANLTIKRFI